jgi:hypothetical protein
MPPSEIHDKKKSKNRVMLAAILGWIALIWIITMVKMTVHGG